ncbi:nucleoside-diphosphate-sugar epimerase [Acinetobacter calcoaceticus]|uniref:Nucleoside-diphosphate-sugar epimerase n=1 Tax=Acinetobacter calcoaceticus TaxID=471 RepID=A0A4R1Y194_ACICA|nr:nucleoside-diphosphate-sugar epimerase [Acinetobacter calcoaceticus]
MHILFVGYGKTSQRVAKHLFQSGHKISTISRSPKPQDGATHQIQDIHHLDLSQFQPIDYVYVLLTPGESSAEAYQQTYVDSVKPIAAGLAIHPIKRIFVVSSTRVYGEDQGQHIDDLSPIKPSDEQGQLLLQMEQLWQELYPHQVIIIRPSGIYGTSIARMIKLAETTQYYPKVHWSNRIHIEDLAAFLAYILHVEQPAASYIVSNNQPTALHETIQWFQKQLNLAPLQLESELMSGKKIYAPQMLETGFQLQHQDCFQDYLALLQQD